MSKSQGFKAEILSMHANVVWINSWQENMDVQKPAKEFSYLKPGTEIQEDKRVDALINDKPVIAKLYDCSMNSIFFLNLPENSIIILDNASFNKKSEIEKISQLYKYRVYLLIFYCSAKKFKIYEIGYASNLKISLLFKVITLGYFRSE